MAQLLSKLPLGSKIKYGKHSINGETAQSITWLVVAKNHSGYPNNSVTLFAEKVIDIRCFDMREKSPSHQDRIDDGNNRYSYSNIDQWLNKDNAANVWWVATHEGDTPPTNSSYVKASYGTRPAFLHSFSTQEKNAILSTTIRTNLTLYDGDAPEDISRKMFLPSGTELLGASAYSVEGSQWEYIARNNNVVRGVMTDQCYEYSPCEPTEKSSTYWCRSANLSGRTSALFHQDSNNTFLHTLVRLEHGVRPAFNLSSSVRVSDTTDADGCYTIVWNTAPSAPTTFNVPSKIYGGKSNVISWSPVTDPDGDVVTYQLECSVNGGAYAQIYSGVVTSYTHLVPFGTTSVAYRVKATDPSGESSTYNTSTTITVVNNNAPVISGSDGNLGVKSSGFTGTYTVTDANNNTVTVTEAIDGVQIRSLVATLGEEITYGVTETTWLALPNGSHTLTIRATDGIDTAIRTYTFTKLVETLKIQNSTPWVSATMPTRIMLVVTKNVPSTSTFKVEVCNNGYDASPKWEDCTDAVKSGLVHVFTNTTKTATNWGVLVRVSVSRNGATGACYVSAIGGNFE